MIVVEGLDNTGKTTLVSKILERYPQLKYRASIGNKHNPEQIARSAQDEAYSWDMMKRVVSDRSRIFSEYVYTPLLKNRPPAYPFHAWLEMMGTFCQHEHVIVHCSRHRAKIIDDWDSSEQLEGVREHLSELEVRYEHLMDMLWFLSQVTESRLRIVHYNFETVSDTQVFIEVERYMERVGI